MAFSSWAREFGLARDMTQLRLEHLLKCCASVTWRSFRRSLGLHNLCRSRFSSSLKLLVMLRDSLLLDRLISTLRAKYTK
jgi:hypothetical protein